MTIKTLKILCMVAKATGSFPASNIFHLRKHFALQQVKKLSASFILSCSMGFLVKFFASIGNAISSVLVEQLNTPSDDSPKAPNTSSAAAPHRMFEMDHVAASLGTLFVNFFPFVVHFLMVYKTKQFLKVADLMEQYVELHGEPKSFWRNISIWGSALCSIFPLVAATYLCIQLPVVVLSSLKTPSGKQPPIWMKRFTNDSSYPLYAFSLLNYAAFVVSEYSVIFFLLQVLLPARFLCLSLTQMVSDVEVSALQTSPHIKSTWTLKDARIRNWGQEIQEAFHSPIWKVLIRRYIQLEQVFSSYNDFVGPYLTVSLSFSVASTICMIYIHFRGTSDIVIPNAGLRFCIVEGTCLIGAFRILALTNIGESIKKKREQLVRRLILRRSHHIAHKKDVTSTSSGDELGISAFLQVVESLPLKLTAAGFFTVGRKNVTSIIGLMLTYCIVLQQFSMTEN